MKYKAIFLDLDGTTIPNKPDGMPSARVVESIANASKRLHVCVATNRPLGLAAPVIERLTINGLCVVNDSTQIYDPQTKRFLKTIYLDDAHLPAIMDIARRYSDRILVNSGRGEDAYTGEPLANLCSVYVGDAVPEVAERLVEELTKIPDIAVHKMPAWKPGEVAVAVSHATATKLHGVEEVAKLLNVTTHEMIGVGDGYNDFPMLMACGLKIAMGNAVSELTAIADFVAPSVEEDGVATVIEKFILI